MGLDGVELLMAVEENFKIVITEQESINIKTPQDLCDIVYPRYCK